MTVNTFTSTVRPARLSMISKVGWEYFLNELGSTKHGGVNHYLPNIGLVASDPAKLPQARDARLLRPLHQYVKHYSLTHQRRVSVKDVKQTTPK